MLITYKSRDFRLFLLESLIIFITYRQVLRNLGYNVNKHAKSNIHNCTFGLYQPCH